MFSCSVTDIIFPSGRKKSVVKQMKSESRSCTPIRGVSISRHP